MENYNGLTMSPPVAGDNQNMPTTTMGNSALNEGYPHNSGMEFDEGMMLYVTAPSILALLGHEL